MSRSEQIWFVHDDEKIALQWQHDHNDPYDQHGLVRCGNPRPMGVAEGLKALLAK
jgi:hypothetical protein